jgi:hypothetical protein
MAELGVMLKEVTSVNNPRNRNYGLIPEEVKEDYAELRRQIPLRFTDYFLRNCALGEFG